MAGAYMQHAIRTFPCLIIPSCFLFACPFDDNFLSLFLQLEYFGAYSKISDLVLGFDERVLQVAFKVRRMEDGLSISFLELKLNPTCFQIRCLRKK